MVSWRLLSISEVNSINFPRAACTAHVLPMPEGPTTTTTRPSLENSSRVFCLEPLEKYLSMDEETDEGSLSKQMLSMILENNAIRDTAYPYLTGWIVFNVVVMILLIYISVRISLR
jgi:hypothetical protein